MRTTGRQLPFSLSPTTVVTRVAVVAIAAAGLFAVTGGQALASHVRCGDTITADAKLDSDLVNCPRNGVEIGADDITLDLNGHTIDGDEPEDCGEICDFGVVNFDHAGVTIEGGSVREFALALLVVGAADNRLLDLSAIRSSFGGVVIAESPRTRFERNTVVANGLNTDQAGVGVFSSPDSRFARNQISDNGDIGVFGLEADDVVFERNVLSGHPEAAFLIEGSRNVFSRNRVVRNAEGITVGGDENVITRNHVSDVPLSEEGGGLGIFVAAGHDNLVARNVVVRAARVGIQVSLLAEELEGGPPAVNTVVRHNLLRGNRDGVFVLETAENTLIEDNLALGSEDDGIDVDSPLTTLTGNHALRNGDLGIEAILGVTDGGGNRAHSNGNPVQCTNIVCR